MSLLMGAIGLGFMANAVFMQNNHPMSYFDFYLTLGLAFVIIVIYHVLMVEKAEIARRRPRIAVDHEGRVDLTMLPPLQHTDPTGALTPGMYPPMPERYTLTLHNV